jgi:plastocyanin
MRSPLILAGLLAVLGLTATNAVAQREVHQIRLEASSQRDVYRFSPARVTARPGDVLVFKAVSGTPHSIVFEGANLPGPVREALNGSMGRRSSDLSSPLLTPDGAEYRITVPAIPPGDYGFFCLPHRAYDMRGILRVAK